MIRLVSVDRVVLGRVCEAIIENLESTQEGRRVKRPKKDKVISFCKKYKQLCETRESEKLSIIYNDFRIIKMLSV